MISLYRRFSWLRSPALMLMLAIIVLIAFSATDVLAKSHFEKTDDFGDGDPDGWVGAPLPSHSPLAAVLGFLILALRILFILRY